LAKSSGCLGWTFMIMGHGCSLHSFPGFPCLECVILFWSHWSRHAVNSKLLSNSGECQHFSTLWLYNQIQSIYELRLWRRSIDSMSSIWCAFRNCITAILEQWCPLSRQGFYQTHCTGACLGFEWDLRVAVYTSVANGLWIFDRHEFSAKPGFMPNFKPCKMKFEAFHCAKGAGASPAA